MKHPTLHLRSVLGMLAAPGLLQAGSYTQNFNSFADGTTNLNDQSFLSSNPFNAAACGVQGQRLRLSSAAVGGTSSIYRLPELDPGYEINGFDFQFDMAVSQPGGTPADGFSLNFGALPLTDTSGPGEEGYQLPGGMVISFDTYINGGAETTRTIDVRVDGATVASKDEAFFGGYSLTGAVKHMTIHWDDAGLDVIYQDVATGTKYVICENLAVPGLRPANGDRFAFGARTGGATEDLHIDNLAVTTATLPPITTGNVVFSELNIDNTANQDEYCGTPGWVEIYNGTATAKDLSTFTLSDDPLTPAKWAFPAGTVIPAYQYRIVYFGYDKPPAGTDTRLHTNFTPVKSGGFLGIYEAGTLVDSFSPYPAQAQDVSYGYLGTGRTLGFLETPTPGSKNTGLQEAGPPVSEQVAWSRDGGLITSPVNLTIGAPVTPGAQIRYTLDNTAPTPSSPLYDHTTPGIIPVSASSNIRARIFAPGRLPGKVTSRTFLKMDDSLANYRGTGQPFSSNLPVVVIDSFGRSIDSENSTAPGARPFRYAYAVVIDRDPANGNRTVLSETAPLNFQGRSGVRVRGESSAGMAQRQYAWETLDNEGNDKDVSILGLPAESDWILYAPSTDKTMLRNFTAYSSMLDTNGQGSAMRTRFVEVFFNQPALGGVSEDPSSEVTYRDYRGIYVLVEKIKRGNDRVDIAKLDPCDTSEPAISGGYIFKKDKVSTDPDFNTTNQALQIVEPAVTVGDAQWTWLRDHVNAFEAALYGPNFADPVLGYRAFIDEQSFMDNQWWVEIFKQIDGYRLSTYFQKDRGQKIKSAPLWDYNLSGGNADYLNGWDYRGWYYNAGISQTGFNNDYQYYGRLRQDSGYVLRHWDRFWKLRKSTFATPALTARIDAAIAQVTDGQPAANIKNSLNWDTVTYGSATNTPQLWPNSRPSIEVPAARHHARWQRLGIYDWPNAPGRDDRDFYVSANDAATFAALTATPYNVTTPPVMSETVHMKAFLQNRLAWIDNAFISGTTIMRPPVLSQDGGNVSAPYSLTIAPFTGTAPAASNYGLSGTLTYPSGPIYYTTDGSEPSGTVIPGITRSLVTDTNACSVVVPTATAGGSDTSARDWKTPDFDPASIPGGTPVWKTGLNGVGYDASFTAAGSVNFFPNINILMAATVPAGANPVPAVVYGSAMQGVNQTCYIRLPFTLTEADLAGLAKLRLYGKVDDGFAAYVNGVLIATSNVPVTLAWNSGATGLQPNSDADGLVYREFSTINNPAAIAALRAGTNVLAIQGLNSGVSSSDLIHRYKLDAETAATWPASATAQAYTGPVAISSGTLIRARQFDTATSQWTPLTEATFVVDTVPAGPASLAVSEIMYNPAPPTAEEAAAGFNDDKMFEYVEIHNAGTTSIDLSGVTFSGAFTFTWPSADPALRVLPAGGRAVIAGNAAAFNLRYKPAASVKIAGVMDGNLSNSGEQITITGPGGILRDFSYDDQAPWPVEADGSGPSLVLINPASNPDHSLPSSWRASVGHGNPGSSDASAYGTWQADNAPGQTDTADEDHDGLSTFWEYVSGGAPGTANTGLLPFSSLESLPGGAPDEQFQTLSATIRAGADDVQLFPESSDGLADWSSTGMVLHRRTANPNGTVTYTWRHVRPWQTDQRVFMRLRAVIP